MGKTGRNSAHTGPSDGRGRLARVIRYRLIAAEGSRAEYEYAVEGDQADTGTVCLDLEANTCEVTEPSPT